MCHGTICEVRRIILAQNTGFNKVIENILLAGSSGNISCNYWLCAS